VTDQRQRLRHPAVGTKDERAVAVGPLHGDGEDDGRDETGRDGRLRLCPCYAKRAKAHGPCHGDPIRPCSGGVGTAPAPAPAPARHRPARVQSDSHVGKERQGTRKQSAVRFRPCARACTSRVASALCLRCPPAGRLVLLVAASELCVSCMDGWIGACALWWVRKMDGAPCPRRPATRQNLDAVSPGRSTRGGV
jgi:hypothetical protein